MWKDCSFFSCDCDKSHNRNEAMFVATRGLSFTKKESSIRSVWLHPVTPETNQPSQPMVTFTTGSSITFKEVQALNDQR